MHVVVRPIATPVALIERRPSHKGGEPVRVLVVREGLLAPPIVALLGNLLKEV